MLLSRSSRYDLHPELLGCTALPCLCTPFEAESMPESGQPMQVDCIWSRRCSPRRRSASSA